MDLKFQEWRLPEMLFSAFSLRINGIMDLIIDRENSTVGPAEMWPLSVDLS
jgi:hypothetical protein